MVAIAGTWYNAIAIAQTDNTRPGYVLNTAAIRKIAALLPLAPITYEHKGLSTASAHITATGDSTRRALETVGAKQFHKSSNTRDLGMQPVGAITSAWVGADGNGHFTGFILAAMPAVARLIQNGRITGISLTHEVSTDMPVEVTLTTEPARPQCYVRAFGADATALYKRQHSKPVTPATATTAMDTATDPATAAVTPAAVVTAPDASPLETAMGALDSTTRAVIEARMEEMVAAADAATARAKQLEAQGTDYEVMRDQLEQVNSQLTDHQRRVFNIQPEVVKAQLESHNEQRILGATNRMLMACSARMMELNGSEPTAKRHRAAEPTSAAAAATIPSPAAAHPEPSSNLRRALAASFEMG